MHYIRSFLAVLLGYVFLALSLTMFDLTANIIDPSAVRPTLILLILSTVFKLIAGTIAGFIAASLTRRKRMAHAGALAVISIMIALIQFDRTGLTTPIWAQSLGIITVFLGVLFGGWLRVNFGSYIFDSTKEEDRPT